MYATLFISFILLNFTLIGCAKPKFLKSTPTTTESLTTANAPDNLAPDEENRESQQPPTTISSTCQQIFTQSRICLEWEWIKTPTASEPGILEFKTFNLETANTVHQFVDLENLPKVTLWMPSMGHGSTPTKTTRIIQGHYRCEKVFFIMPGAWQIQFQFTNSQGQKDETIVNLII